MSKAEIETAVRRVLGQRRNPPGISDEQRAAHDDNSVAYVQAHAPDHGWQEWLGMVTERVITSTSGVSYPGTDKWAEGCKRATSAQRKAGNERLADSFDETKSARQQALDLFARQVNTGQPVSENHVFGDVAHTAQSRGYVTAEQVKAYMRAAFNQRKKIYGFDSALRWLSYRAPHLAEQVAAKRAAKEAARQPHAD